MRKFGKKLVALGLTAGMLCTMSTPVFARNYNLTITSPYVGSMASTIFYTKTKAGNPYVQPNKSTLKTKYFISTKRLSSTVAAGTVTVSDTSRYTMSWRTGYGGTNINYCLSACPGVNTDYDTYNVSGTWSE